MRTTGEITGDVAPVVSGAELIDLQQLVRRIPAPEGLVAFAVRLARSTRPADDLSPAITRRYASWGAGPRASQYLVLGAKARAAMDGRPVPNFQDVRAVAPSVLAHRLVLNFEAEADGLVTRDIVSDLIRESEGWT
jgi:MoxR-like ATPase